MPYKNKEKQREYQRLWMKKRREDFFFGKCCVECGSIHRLELDHIDPSTKISHAIWSWSKERRHKEIDKCQVLCNSCHKEKTAKQLNESNSKPLIHGKISGYRKGCRCESCHQALLIWWREYRKIHPRGEADL